jgi:hypothetical protein
MVIVIIQALFSIMVLDRSCGSGSELFKTYRLSSFGPANLIGPRSDVLSPKLLMTASDRYSARSRASLAWTGCRS